MALGETHSVRVPRWLPALLYLTVTVILFRQFIFSDRMLYGEDILGLGYMARAFLADRLAAGDLPLWAPRLLGGVPMFEALSGGDAIYPTSLLYLVMEPYRALGWKLVLHILAGGFFMYGWVRALGLTRPAATIAGLAWLMAPVVVTLVLPGNDGKLMVASLAPLVFWAAERALHTPSGRSVAALAGAVALTSLVTQFQTAYFLFGSVGVYALFRVIQQGREEGQERGKRTGMRRAALRYGVFLGASLLGGGIAAVQLLPAGQYVTESSRRIATTVAATPEERLAYASSWSLHPEEALSLVVPEFAGSSAANAEWGQGTYWGRNPFKLNHEYLGVTVTLLALFGLLGRDRRGLRRFMAGMSLIWLLFALGAHTPVWRIFYEAVPGISIFRVPSLAAFLVSFGATTLLALGIDDLVRASPTRGAFLASNRGRALLGAGGLLLIGSLLQASGILANLWMTTIYSDATERSHAALLAATPFMTRGFGIALLLAGLLTAILWMAREGRMPIMAALAVIALLVAIDLGRIDSAFIRTLDYHGWTATDANIRLLQERSNAETPFRVADLRGNDQSVELAMHGLDLVAGHHPNDLARYRMLLGLQGSRRAGANTRHPNVLRMMNVRYLLWPDEAAGRPPYEGAEPLSSARTAAGLQSVYRYPGLERAWLVERSRVEENDEAALAQILDASFDPAQEAILAEPPGIALEGGGGAGQGRVVWERFDPDHRVLRVRATAPALMVIAENWFPGWVAEIDGVELPVRRANLTLQAIEIPSAGDHRITLRFTAPMVASALRLTSGSLAIVLVLLAVSLARSPPSWLPGLRRA